MRDEYGEDLWEEAGMERICKRCAVKQMLGGWEKEVWLEDVLYGEVNEREWKTSLGVKVLGREELSQEDIERMGKERNAKSWGEWHALENGYERWEDIFERLGI